MSGAIGSRPMQGLWPRSDCRRGLSTRTVRLWSRACSRTARNSTGSSRRRLEPVEFLAVLEQARDHNLTVLVDKPRRQSDLGHRPCIGRDPIAPDIDQKLEVGLSDICYP